MPNPSFMPDTAKTEDKIRISCTDICGEEDFRCWLLRNAGVPVGRPGKFQGKKAGYDLNIGGVKLADKVFKNSSKR